MTKWLASFAMILATFTGCGERRTFVPATGSYGPPSEEAPTSVERARSDRSTNASWMAGTLSVIETELTPASLWHSTSRTLSFFANMPATGIGGPSYVCISTEQGPKIFQHGAIIDPARMRESWFVVWFAGASGWTNWDSPWLLTLQHRPRKIVFDTNGLHFTFTNEAGYAALMPMYGYYKPLAAEQGNHPFTKLKEKKKRILTWEWAKALPADPLARARYWASALREFPIYCEDSFSVDRAHDGVVLRQKFRFVSWNDDWKTKHLKLAPMSPALALAYHEGFPAEFSKKPFDMEIFTAFGPLYGVEGVDTYDVTLPVLQYVNETEVIGGTVTNQSPIVQSALNKLRAEASEMQRPTDFCDAIHAEEWRAKALPYLDATARAKATARLKKFFREEVLVTNRFKLRRDAHSSREYLAFDCDADGTQLNAAVLQGVWAWAHFGGDWELVRERWPLIKLLFIEPLSTGWVGFGPHGVVALGDDAAGALAFARLAYKAGDMDSYNYGCQMFARELAHHYAKQRGAKYFQDNQPYRSMEPIDGDVFLTSLHTDGWHIGGPKYPANAVEREFEKRWRRFHNEDVARFYRELLPVDVKRELDVLPLGSPGERRARNEPDALPSLVQLRSLLLNESPAQLASNAVPDKFTGSAGGVIANCLAILRASRPPRFERLIPGGEPSPFVAGIERDVAGPNVFLTQQVGAESNSSTRITWPVWKTPTGVAWNFGEVSVATNAPAVAEAIPLNWNSRVTSSP